MSEPIHVPIQHIIDVAKIASELQARGCAQGLPVEDLHLVVEEGALTLNDHSGTFGTRRWSTSATAGATVRKL